MELNKDCGNFSIHCACLDFFFDCKGLQHFQENELKAHDFNNFSSSDKTCNREKRSAPPERRIHREARHEKTGIYRAFKS